MTKAPGTLLHVRSLLLEHLNVDPKTSRAADLEPAEVGIVGDSAHRGGYHCGSNRTVTNDYSVFESPRDRAGLTLDAAALDVGGFEVRSGGKLHTLATFSVWCVGECERNAADTRDIREIIYSPDGKVVKRWDRLGRRSSGDSSHRWHTHFSFFRDAIKAGRDQTPLFRRYLQSIGLITTTPTAEDEMTPEEHNWLKTVHNALTKLDGRNPLGQVYTRITEGTDHLLGAEHTQTFPSLVDLGRDLRGLRSALETMTQRDADTVITGVLAGLTPEKIAAAIPPTMARQVADELARRLAS